MSVSDQIQPLYKQYSDLVFRIKSLEKKFSCDYCTEVDKCLGISSNGNPNKFLNEQGDFVTISSSGFSCDDLNNCNTDNLPEGVTNLYFSDVLAIAALTGQNISIFNNNVGYITSAALAPYLTIASAAATYYPLTNPSNYITLSSLSAGTGISYNNLTGVIANSSPDVPVVLNNGTAINITGVYPNFTINNTAPDQIVTLNTTGSGFSITGTYPSFTLQNTLPDQTVVLNSGTGISTSGTYPNFTIANTDTGSAQNIFKNIAVSGQNTVVANSNNDTLTLVNGTGVNITTNATTDTITITNSAPDQVVSLTQGGTTTITGTYPNFTISSADQFTGTVTSVAALTLGTTGTDLNSTVANSTTTPVITLNVPTASATNRGVLSSADWSTFNSKMPTAVSADSGNLTKLGTDNLVFTGRVVSSSHTIDFSELKQFGTIALPLTTSLLVDYTGAVNGMVQIGYHKAAAKPAIPVSWTEDSGSFAYVANQPNFFAVWFIGNSKAQIIWRGQA